MHSSEIGERFKAFGVHNYREIPELQRLGTEIIDEIGIVAQVLPFRVNDYVIKHLIDWDKAPDDPIYRLVFPNRDMLDTGDFEQVRRALLTQNTSSLDQTVQGIRTLLNPHPGDQLSKNVPLLDEEPLMGLQHKYRETVLFFPSPGQTCHSYCTYCFRWAQFVGDKSMRFESKDRTELIQYLQHHPEVTDVLITGGDPLVMNTRLLEHYIEPLLSPEFDHIRNIRIGTKALSYWPQRFLTDPDADDLLRLLERVVKAGKSLAFMAHYIHWREVEAELAVMATKRIRSTGAVIRSQGPVLKHINDDPRIWARMWEAQVKQGISPYYMFVNRDTGARRYFELPLTLVADIYRQAAGSVSGLARTAKGPVMSTSYGKVEVLGVVDIGGERAFALRLIQGRQPNWTFRPFFAAYSPHATWLDDLRPAFGDAAFFFQHEEDGA